MRFTDRKQGSGWLAKCIISIYRYVPRELSSMVVRCVKPTFPIGVVTILFNTKGQVLLLQHTYHQPRWRLPGGLMERQESLLDVARREILEEANMEVRPICVVDADCMGYSFDVAVLAELVKEHAFMPNAEVIQAAWFSMSALPPLSPVQKQFIQSGARYLSLLSNCQYDR